MQGKHGAAASLATPCGQTTTPASSAAAADRRIANSAPQSAQRTPSRLRAVMGSSRA